jgi:hypothetical protein
MTLLTVLYFSFLPENWEQVYEKQIIRVFLFTIAFFLFPLFVPFLQKGNENGFWQYNRILFLRFFFTGAYCIILFLGILFAYLGGDMLFELSFPERIYPITFVLLFGIFGSVFFLSGIPQNILSLEKKTDYPQGISFFSRFVLSPILIIYAAILLAYLVKILLSRQWPEGIVAWIILLFSAGGIFLVVLMHPLKDLGRKWAIYGTKIFFTLEIPFAIMLLSSLWIRISGYGLTELRYYAVAIGIWLFGIACLFLFQKKPTLKIIPISLFLFCLLSSFGPWGAIALSEKSQVNRLQTVLEVEGLLQNGKIQKADSTLDRRALCQINSSVSYILDTHGTESLQPWFERDIEKYLVQQERGNGCWTKGCFFSRNLLGIPYVSGGECSHSYQEIELKTEERRDVIYYSSGEDKTQNISGYTDFISYKFHSYESHLSKYQEEEQQYFIISGPEGELSQNDVLWEYVLTLQQQGNTDVNLIVEYRKNGERNMVARIPFSDFLSGIRKKYPGYFYNNVPPKDMVIFSKDKNVKLHIQTFTYREITQKHGTSFLPHMEADIFIRRSEQ